MQAGSRDRVDRRLAAILAADLVGYSRLMEAGEVGTARMLREQRAAADPLISGQVDGCQDHRRRRASRVPLGGRCRAMRCGAPEPRESDPAECDDVAPCHRQASTFGWPKTINFGLGRHQTRRCTEAERAQSR